ncbi:MAG: M48 family metalloprotease [Bacillota bacterium]|jgi:heat shock protein HtpX|nr:M48 family metalloprotease [Bacillota bacterium]
MLNAFRIVVLAGIAFVNWVILALFLSMFGASDALAGWGALLVEAALVGLAFTPLGEKYFRFANRLRRPLPDEEKTLRPAFGRAVVRCGLAEYPELFVAHDPFPNALAAGVKTVAVTRGLLEQAKPEELEAVLAHELGHLKNGDTKVLLAAYVMNAAGSFATWVMTIFMAVLSAFSFITGGAAGDREFIGLGWFIVAISWMLRGVTWLLQKILELSFLAVGRAQEYEADAFAARCGYRDGLVSFLSRIVGPEGPRSLAAVLYATHPSPEARIERLMRLA